MNILIVDPKSAIGPKVKPVLKERNWGCLVEPDRFDNILQIGLVLSDTLTSGIEVILAATYVPAGHSTSGLAAD